MTEIEFRVPQNFNAQNAERAIEEICEKAGLVLGKKGALASFPGSIHWHYKKKQQSGTLELTLWPAQNRLWAQVQAGRKAPWIFAELPRLRRAIEAALRAG